LLIFRFTLFYFYKNFEHHPKKKKKKSFPTAYMTPWLIRFVKTQSKIKPLPYIVV